LNTLNIIALKKSPKRKKLKEDKLEKIIIFKFTVASSNEPLKKGLKSFLNVTTLFHS